MDDVAARLVAQLSPAPVGVWSRSKPCRWVFCSTLTTSVRRTAEAGAMIGRGSGEAYQLCLTGVVVVQACEGHPKPQQG